MALIDDLGAGPVGVGTAIFICFIGENSRFLPLIVPVCSAADAGKSNSLQLVTSLAAGCSSFLTYDRRLPSVPGLKVVQLDR